MPALVLRLGVCCFLIHLAQTSLWTRNIEIDGRRPENPLNKQQTPEEESDLVECEGNRQRFRERCTGHWGITCAGKCGQRISLQLGMGLDCSCDRWCLIFNDCCWDFRAECESEANSLPAQATQLVGVETECKHNQFAVVSGCPAGTSLANDSDGHLTVLHPEWQISYKNRSVFECNHGDHAGVEWEDVLVIQSNISIELLQNIWNKGIVPENSRSFRIEVPPLDSQRRRCGAVKFSVSCRNFDLTECPDVDEDLLNIDTLCLLTVPPETNNLTLAENTSLSTPPSRISTAVPTTTTSAVTTTRTTTIDQPQKVTKVRQSNSALFSFTTDAYTTEAPTPFCGIFPTFVKDEKTYIFSTLLSINVDSKVMAAPRAFIDGWKEVKCQHDTLGHCTMQLICDKGFFYFLESCSSPKQLNIKYYRSSQNWTLEQETGQDILDVVVEILEEEPIEVIQLASVLEDAKSTKEENGTRPLIGRQEYTITNNQLVDIGDIFPISEMIATKLMALSSTDQFKVLSHIIFCVGLEHFEVHHIQHLDTYRFKPIITERCDNISRVDGQGPDVSAKWVARSVTGNEDSQKVSAQDGDSQKQIKNCPNPLDNCVQNCGTCGGVVSAVLAAGAILSQIVYRTDLQPR